MARIDVRFEREKGRGWAYDVDILREDGSTSTHRVTLAWVDHDHWTGGSCPPSRTVEAVLRYVVDHAPGQALPAAFDAARARRWLPAIDSELRTAM